MVFEFDADEGNVISAAEQEDRTLAHFPTW